MNSLERFLNRLGEQLQVLLRGLFGRYEQGSLTRPELVQVAAQTIAAGNQSARSAALAVVRAEVEKQTRAPHPLPPVDLTEDLTRLTDALTTILDDELQDTLTQLDRVADNEPKQAAAQASGDFIRDTESVTGWTRQLDSDACQLCTWWWRAGRVWPDDHVMPRHVGCTCTQTPVTTDWIQPVGTDARARSDRDRANQQKETA